MLTNDTNAFTMRGDANQHVEHTVSQSNTNVLSQINDIPQIASENLTYRQGSDK